MKKRRQIGQLLLSVLGQRTLQLRFPTGDLGAVQGQIVVRILLDEEIGGCVGELDPAAPGREHEAQRDEQEPGTATELR